MLNAWGNQLTSLPDGFGALTSLIRLGLKGNQLAALPDSFTQLSSLVELFLTDNKLTTLPAGGHEGGVSGIVLVAWHAVVLLRASCCDDYDASSSYQPLSNQLFCIKPAPLLHFKHMCTGFGNLRSLVKLQASYNPLESLPQDLWQLPALELFRLAVGNLPQWPARVGAWVWVCVTCHTCECRVPCLLWILHLACALS